VTEIPITVVVNGEQRAASAEPRRTLAEVLRTDLLLTGTHTGCEHGVCGSCTVLIDGQPVRSCLMLAVQADGRDITTIEGLEQDAVGRAVQEAMRDSHAFQCGFCTPGFLTTITALIRETDRPLTRTEIRQHLAGNICRCSGYEPIIDAVEAVAARVREAVA
jgi:carbon-monoxide dehydrogenase small subunit